MEIGSELSIHADATDFNSYLLLKQEYSMKTYMLALTNSVKIVNLPFTKTHLNAIRDCNRYKKPSLFYNQHSLELRFPSVLNLMSEVSEKYKHAPGNGYFDIQWNDNRTYTASTDGQNHKSVTTDNSHKLLDEHDTSRVFDEPVFFYLQSFVYYIVYCSYKPRGKENWKKGAAYLEEIAEHVVSTPDWETNKGVDFLSPASHPKSGPMNVHPASLNFFLRQSFLRTDFDFTGNRPKDIVVPYYVEYTQDPERYFNNATSGGRINKHGLKPLEAIRNRQEKLRMRTRGWGSTLTDSLSTVAVDSEASANRELIGDSVTKSTLILFVGSRNPLHGLREEFEQAFQLSVDRHLHTDIVYTTEVTSQETYKRLLFNAEFCLCVRGDTASSGRLFSVIEAGCIPVLISDWLHLPFQSLIDYSQFTLNFPESIVNNVDYLVDYLRHLPAERKARMRQSLVDVRPLLLYETSRSDLYALNPVTLSLVEALITRKQYCDKLTSSATASPMCLKVARRLQVALLSQQ